LLRSETVHRDQHWPSDWSSRGIVYVSGRDAASDDIWMLPLDGDRKAYPLVREPGQQSEARISPDGKWLAYQTEMPGALPEIVVQSLSTAGGKWRVSTGGGATPRWRPDGKELFYLAADGNLMAVRIDARGEALRTGASTPLFETSHPVVGTGRARTYEVSSNGERFLLLTPDAQARAPSIVVVSNWPALLKQ
ncbi:MAG TPA: hypothetical protein VFZ73_12800, partial [Gemmatimonadaceae bacterium]